MTAMTGRLLCWAELKLSYAIFSQVFPVGSSFDHDGHS
jgi:hypothetical protein